MSWRVVVYGLAGIGAWCVTAFAAALTYLAAVEFGMWRRRNQDRPDARDDTWLRFERSEWTDQQGETK